MTVKSLLLGKDTDSRLIKAILASDYSEHDKKVLIFKVNTIHRFSTMTYEEIGYLTLVEIHGIADTYLKACEVAYGKTGMKGKNIIETIFNWTVVIGLSLFTLGVIGYLVYLWTL